MNDECFYIYFCMLKIHEVFRPAQLPAFEQDCTHVLKGSGLKSVINQWLPHFLFLCSLAAWASKVLKGSCRNHSMWRTKERSRKYCLAHMSSRTKVRSHTQTHLHIHTPTLPQWANTKTLLLTVCALFCLLGQHSMISVLLFVSNLFLSLSAFFLCLSVS